MEVSLTVLKEAKLKN